MAHVRASRAGVGVMGVGGEYGRDGAPISILMSSKSKKRSMAYLLHMHVCVYMCSCVWWWLGGAGGQWEK